MSVRSALLGRFQIADGSTHTLATVPANETWIIKFVTAANNSTLASVTVIGSSDPVSGATSYAVYDNIAAQTMLNRAVFIVCPPGDLIQVFSQRAACVVSIHGAKLAGVSSL